MLRNYLVITLRNLRKYKIYTGINVLGLAIGMACCILILLYIRDELSYDTYHVNADRIYRVTREWHNASGETSLHLGHVAPPISPLLKQDFPEIEQAVRLLNVSNSVVSFGETRFVEQQFFFADAELFEIFTLPLVQGDPQTALADPRNVVITTEMAQKYFGDADPMGKVLQFRGQAELKVAGVMPPMPRNSHFHLDFVGSLEAVFQIYGVQEQQSWGSNNYATYLLLQKDASAASLAAKFPDFIDRHLTPVIVQYTGHQPQQQPSLTNFLHLQKLTDIHLRSHLDSEIEPNGNIDYVYIFFAVACFILLIACINFMNLATARSTNRAREVGMRKVVGASRQQLIRQFIGETVVLAGIALLLALGIVYATLPAFGNFIDKPLELNLLAQPGDLLALIAIALFVGISAGSYPAFFLSKFRPIVVLKGGKVGKSPRSLFRTGLVVFQFAISIILIIAMGVVRDQLEYCRSKELGLQKENILVLPASGQLIERYPDVKNQLLQHPQIVGVAASKRVPSGRLLDSSGSRVLDESRPEPIDFRIANVRVDHDFIDTYGIQMAAGRNFSTAFASDSTEAFILNETAVQKIGWTSPQEAIDRPFEYGGRKGRIIGVVKDFHYESLHQPITPIILLIQPSSFNQISVRIRAENAGELQGVLDFLQGRWQQYRPEFPFTYTFLDERYEQLYQAEHKLGQIFGVFSALAVFIACLGLFGLASYTAEQRTKEIGIRKVLGATVSNIVLMLSREFAVLVGIAMLFAWPIAYYAMGTWLQTFAYRAELHVLTFLLAALLALLLAFVTVSFQALRAALINPAKSLKYE